MKSDRKAVNRAIATRFRAMQHRNFQLFIGGQLVSLIGTWMQTTAQLWLVYKLTGSAALLGVFGFASQVPMLFLSSIGGYVGDRYDRQRRLVTLEYVQKYTIQNKRNLETSDAAERQTVALPLHPTASQSPLPRQPEAVDHLFKPAQPVGTQSCDEFLARLDESIQTAFTGPPRSAK